MSTSSLSLSEDDGKRRFCRESLSLSSSGSYSVCWRWSGDGSERPNQQASCGKRCLSRCDSLEEWMNPPLPGQVPVEPTVTLESWRQQRFVMVSSPVNKSSTGEIELRLGRVKCTDQWYLCCLTHTPNTRFSHRIRSWKQFCFTTYCTWIWLCH